MNIELIGALDYNKVNNIIKKYIEDQDKINEIIDNIKTIEKNRHSEIVSTAGRLSRFPGDTLEVLKLSESKSDIANKNFASRVVGMGHKSITDHDYLVFAIKDVSVIIEQMIIAERFASFTIKSRREVDFSSAGYYVPNFHDENGNILINNEELKEKYMHHMNDLFNNYKVLTESGISQEDARFVLPYCFYSNIIMGCDAHTLLDMIIKFTKTKYSKIEEFKEFGNKLYEIAKEYTPYLIPIIDSMLVKQDDEVDTYLNNIMKRQDYKIINQVKMLNSSSNIDDQILLSAIMRRYQYDYEFAKKIYDEICEKDPNFKIDLMRKIAFQGDKLELSQVNFQFQVPVSYAILTHLTRHRTHKIIVPDFFPNIDLMQYKIPPKIKKNYLDLYNQIYLDNKRMYDGFKKYGIRDEDLIYFTLSGNMTNILTSMDGWTVRHILELRECNKAQWETREISYGIHREIKSLESAKVFEQILGSTCVTQAICNEGKESCGKVRNLIKKNTK